MTDPTEPEERREDEPAEAVREGAATYDEDRPVPDPPQETGVDADREVDLDDGGLDESITGPPELDPPD